MWRRNLYDTAHPPLMAASSGSLTFLSDGVTAAQAEGWMSAASPDFLVGQVWAGVHGLAVLWNTEIFEASFHATPDTAIETLSHSSSTTRDSPADEPRQRRCADRGSVRGQLGQQPVAVGHDRTFHHLAVGDGKEGR